MEQLSFFSVPSPCIGVCQSDAKGYCLGCFRSRDERFNWMSYTDLQKQDINRLCKQRRKRKQYALYKASMQQRQALQSSVNIQLDFADDGETPQASSTPKADD
ncbi:DUF1289 domain-containing protein [Shewanella gaetbuli]|uniref:DUF1289 domain-containing protein n=1 Tax=Shewanella gaetbuli TaxID=220752 RepID=A0A9X1ZJ38_9GAMM|nr:DUF1289 domain-containing protein [Shewanella gaetbuli]MCL1141897.1 DUF1289 domain-containing protein [Shewanella gaetbuli]